MPELPEVETTVRGINTFVQSLVIDDVWTDYDSAFHKGKDNIKDPLYFKHFKKSIVGSRIEHATRRGKNILIHLSGGNTILIHMKMTGHMMYGAYKKLNKKDVQGESWRPRDPNNQALNDPFNRFIHFVLVLSNGNHLVLSDMRRFAKVTLIETTSLDTSPHLTTHGPEPLSKDFTVETLQTALQRKQNGRIKTVLMDHTVIAGVGNIYSDEILWRTGIHPLSIVRSIPQKLWKDIHRAIIETLSRGIDFGGDSMSDYRNIEGKRGSFQEKHEAYRKTGTPCTKKGCPGIIERLKVGGRSAHFCATHQKCYKS